MAQVSQVAMLAEPSAFLLPSAGLKAQVATPGENIVQIERSATSAGASPLGLPLTAVTALGAATALAARRRGHRAVNARGATTSKAFENETGVQAPLGFWDPMAFTKDGDVEDFRRRRETELKHGRVSMFAVMGFITPEYFKFPGYLSPSGQLKFADVPNGLAAIGKVPVEGWLQWVALCGFYELCVNVPQDPADPGNYGRGRLGITGESIADPNSRKRSLNSELANGRLAMVAIMGMIFQNGFIGTTSPAMWIPGSASATEMRAGPKILEGTGGPFPDSFWDPAGLSKGKSDEQLLHWRAVELKHGRVCMMACLGWFYTASGNHAIGDAAARTPVSNDPLIAVTQIPIGGVFQVVFTIMCLEWMVTYVTKPPADKPWDIFGWSAVVYEDEPSWKEEQLKELNNGRLAMMGFIGLVSQELITGDYAPGIIKPCFGNVICDGITDWTKPYPPSAYVVPFQLPFWSYPQYPF
uniref:Uncharacterized protein n=1 Tax=Alexandrium catenella TaxID=2925 RepID=A0A7S1WDL0_ALECA